MALRTDVPLAMMLGLFAGTQLRRPLYESGNGGQSDKFKLWLYRGPCVVNNK